MSAFDRLLEQIDSFIRKYYTNEIVKGFILFLGVLLGSFLLIAVLEYLGRFNSWVRGILFFSFIVVNIYIFGRYLLSSLLKLYSFGKRISRAQAASIIGSFFPQVSDRLLNTLQLNEKGNDGNYELIRASVSQRSNELSVFNFGSAIDIRENRKSAKWVVLLMSVILIIAIVAPAVLRQGTERVVNFKEEFVPVAPFDFMLQNKEFIVEEGSDYEVKLLLKGQSLPDKVYLVADEGKFLMGWSSKSTAEHNLNKLTMNTRFYFEANGFRSDVFVIKVLPKSAIGRMEATIQYPAYLGRTNETIQNSGDLNVPEGSVVEWSILTKNTSKVIISDGTNEQVFKTDGFKYKRTIRSDASLVVKLENRESLSIDSIRMSVIAVRDGYPSIAVNEVKDSVSDGLRFFSGNVADDYGLTSLNFVYTIISKGGKERTERLNVGAVRGANMPFNFAVDFRREALTIDDRIEYYFLVKDNDGVNGAKATKSQTFSYELPSLEELNNEREEDQEKIKEDLASVLKKTQEFQKNAERLKKEVMNSKSMDWKAKNQLDKLKADQLELQKSLQSLQQQMEKSMEEKDQLSEMDDELLEKQQQIEDLLKELMDDEMMELLKKLEELMKEQNKDQMQEQLKDLDQMNEDRSKQLDRSLEMLKKLQVNEKIDDIEKELEKLADEQRELKKDLENNKLSSEKGKEKQDEMNKRFEEIKDDLKKLKELNENLQRPMNLPDKQEQQKKISDKMQESSESLDKNKKSKAGESQEETADELDKLADELDKAQDAANAEQEGEDMEMLRRVLKSLMTLSFDQEDVMKRFSKINESDPLYKRYGRKQRSIVDDTKIVKDSLESLAKRQPKIASFVDAELNQIRENHELSLEDIDERRRRPLEQHQQLVMTSYNNLALMLNESLESMQEQARSKKEGDGSCDKPGGKGKPKPGQGQMGSSDMKQMLKKQLEALEKGKSPGGQKPGDSPGGEIPGGQEGQGMQGMGSKQLSKMAAEQSAIRQRLEQIRDELNKEGKGSGNGLNPLINELDKQERDLLNRNFSPTVIQRQRDILTRLLESDKALMERGFEEKRESKQGKDKGFGNQIRFEEYNKEKLKQVELLRSVDPVFRKYYKDKANQYFNNAL